MSAAVMTRKVSTEDECICISIYNELRAPMVEGSMYVVSCALQWNAQEGAPGLEDGHVVAYTYPPEVEDFGSSGMG
jgi:hypothetical protein